MGSDTCLRLYLNSALVVRTAHVARKLFVESVLLSVSDSGGLHKLSLPILRGVLITVLYKITIIIIINMILPTLPSKGELRRRVQASLWRIKDISFQ